MAQKTTAPAKPAARKTTVTPVRNSAVPKKTVAAAKKRVVITHEMIAERAYFISLSGTGSSEQDNWHRAERELRGSL